MATELSDFGLRLLDSVDLVKTPNSAGENVTMSGRGKKSSRRSLDKSPYVDRIRLSLEDTRTKTVIVYLDRAEVTRELLCNVKVGENEILLRGMSQFADPDSVRVESEGPANITEVAFDAKFLTPEEEKDKNRCEREADDRLSATRRKHETLWNLNQSYRKQRNVLDGFANKVVNAGTAKDEVRKNGDAAMLNSDTLAAMAGFFELYDKQAERLDGGIIENEYKLTLITKEREELERRMADKQTITGIKEARQLSIIVDALAEGELKLSVSYVVSQAKWTPTYDIRVFADEQKIKIMYYAMIQQNSGEDWNETKICLSTALPRVGGTIPDLGIQKLSFKQKTLYHLIESDMDLSIRHPRGGTFGASRRSKKRSVSSPCTPTPQTERQRWGDEALKNISPEKWFKEETELFDEVPSEVKENITSTTFQIARYNTIPGDNIGHRVAVAIIDLDPTFSFECTPKKSTYVYLKAKLQNTSPYALMSGPTNIFLDNNFVAKAELKAVNPGEEFSCSLGVDSNVQVLYKAISKYRENPGIISKTICTTYKQVIELKNNHRKDIRVLVQDHLPLSTEEKIRVTLVEPQIKHPEKYDPGKPIRLNRQNNVEWDLALGAGENREIIMKYTIDHPATEEVEATVMHFDVASDA